MARGAAAIALGAAGISASLSGASGGYDGGRRDNRRLRSYRPGGGSASADTLWDLPDLRARARDLSRNAPIALGAIQTKTNGVVGQGLRLKPQLDFKPLGLSEDQAIERQAQIGREWAIFETECDFLGLLHFKDMQRLIYRSARENGDCGIVRRYVRQPATTYGTRLVLLEADRISNPNYGTDTVTRRGGVEIDADGRVLGYHVSDRHPGDIRLTGLAWSYIPRLGPSGMKQMLLPYQHQRIGQPRGIPIFAPIIEQLKQLADHSTAELNAAVHDALLFAFELLGDQEGQETLIPSVDGSATADEPQGEVRIEDNAIISLSNGSQINVNKPSRPNTAFEPFQLAILKQIGVALEIPFELLIMHFSASFSASRGALEIAWKSFLAEKAWLEREVLDVVYQWFFTEAVALGRIEAPGFLDDPLLRMAWLGRQWIGPTRIQINPQVEANADAIDIASRVKTRDQVIVERIGGGDWERTIPQIRHEEEDIATLPSVQVATTTKAADQQNNSDDGADQSQPDNGDGTNRKGNGQ